MNNAQRVKKPLKKETVIRNINKEMKKLESSIALASDRKRALGLYKKFIKADTGLFVYELMWPYGANALKDLLGDELVKPVFEGDSDDCGDCDGFHVGADGLDVSFFCDPKDAKKAIVSNNFAWVF